MASLALTTDGLLLQDHRLAVSLSSGPFFGLNLCHHALQSCAIGLALHRPPQILLRLQGYGIINLFLLANLITSTATLPVLSGLITTRWAHRVITPATMLFGCWLGFTSLVVYGRIQQPHWALQKGTPLSLSGALHIVFFEAYDWPPFILALGKSQLASASFDPHM